MKYLFILFFSLLVLPFTHGQSKGNFEISTAVGLGVIEGHYGYSIDGEIGKYILPKLSLGVYYNLMSSQRETNPEFDRYRVSIDDLYLQVISNYYTRNIHRSQNSAGLQLKYNLIHRKNFELNLGLGYNYNWYKMLDFTITSSEPFVPHAEYIKYHNNGFSYQIVNDIYFRLNENISLGLKTRFMEFKDHNVSFMLATSVRI